MHQQSVLNAQGCAQNATTTRSYRPGRQCRRIQQRVCAAIAAPLGNAQQQQEVMLPPSLCNSVVVLDAPNPDVPGGITKVYLMGMSHVSKKSVQQVKELIRAVKPEVVGVELCRDRLQLLADNSTDVITNLVWHCRKIEADGLPSDPEWPAWEVLQPLLRCQPGKPVTQQDIEADVITLLSTGLFRSAAPQCRTADIFEAPAFVARPADQLQQPQPANAEESLNQKKPAAAPGEVQLQTVPPLGCIRFVVSPRPLPPITEMTFRLDSSLKAVENPEEQLQQLCADTLAATAVGKSDQVPALTALLRAKQTIAGMFGTRVVTSFLGVETGKIEVLIRAARDTDPAFISGFEGSAQGGDGWGIDPFRPKKNLFKLSEKMYLPMETIDAILAQAKGIVANASQQGTDPSNNGHSPAPLPPPRSSFRLWKREEMEACNPPMFEGSAVADTLVAILTGLYAKYQSQAARKCDVTPGAAWQAALAAASEVGVQHVMLIDRPTVVTERRLADSLLAAAGTRMGAAAGLVLSTLIMSIATDVLPPSTELAGFVGAMAVGAGLCWPILGPIREINALADMTADQIEDAVAIKQPIAGGDLSQPLKLFGEDALLDWPGAMQPIIRDRDTYMAKALAGVATGTAMFSPTYVRGEANGQATWQYMVPESAPEAAAPAGLGDAAVKPLAGCRSVVGIVGSAHVPGMVREWQQSLTDAGSVEKLLTAEQS